jgi:hypothetical protein
MELIEKSVPARNPTEHAGKIPKVINQTFEEASVPEGMHAAATSWVTANPGYTYRFHDAKDRAAFIEKFDKDVYAAYNKLDYGAFKADLWRYCILYVEGGIYSDLDTFCVNSLDHLIDPADEFIVPKGKRAAVFNAFICSRPRHPFLKAAITRATRLIHEGKVEDGFEITGPVNLGIAINTCLGRPEESAHAVGTHAFDGGHYRIIEKRNPSKELPGHVVAGDGTVLFYNKYEGYLTDLKSAGVDHWAARSMTETIALGITNPSMVRKWLTRKIRKALR